MGEKKKITTDIEKLLKEEEFGATPYAYQINQTISANSFVEVSIKPGKSTTLFGWEIYLFKEWKVGDVPENSIYMTIYCDGREVFPRSYINSANKNTKLPKEIKVESEIYIKLENDTDSAILFTMQVLFTIYNRNLIEDLKRALHKTETITV